MPQSHQTLWLIPIVKLLKIMLRNRCWSTTFSHYYSGKCEHMIPELARVINPLIIWWWVMDGKTFQIRISNSSKLQVWTPSRGDCWLFWSYLLLNENLKDLTYCKGCTMLCGRWNIKKGDTSLSNMHATLNSMLFKLTTELQHNPSCFWQRCSVYLFTVLLLVRWTAM